MKALGTLVIGRFVKSGPVIKGDGTVVEGLYNVEVDVSMGGGSSLTRRVSYNAVDQETGEPTPFSTQLGLLKAKTGDAVVCKVAVTTRQGSQYANLNGRSIARLADLDLAV